MQVTPRQAEKLVEYSIQTRRSLLLVGPPGIGKSEIIEAVTRRLNVKLIYCHAAVHEPTDFRGLGVVVPGTPPSAEWIPFGTLKQLCDATEPTVAFFDDLGQAPEAVQTALMQLLQARRIGEHRISDSVTFLAATNRRRDRAGVHGIITAIQSRFRTIVELVPDVDDWCRWAIQESLPATGVAFVRMRPNYLIDCAKPDFRPSVEIQNDPRPRTVTEALRHELECQALGLGDEILLPLLAGAAGDGFAIEYMAFRKLAKALPDPVAILMAPDTAPTPDMTKPEGPGLAYAVALALGRVVNETSMANALRYLARLGQAEYEAVCLKAAIARDSSLASAPTFLSWAADNADLIL